MGFLTGRVGYARLRLDKPAPKLFGPDQLETLGNFAFGSRRKADKEGGDHGWIAGDDILDTDFELAKNIVNDTLHFALRIDSLRLPSDLYRAYYRIDLKALSAGNPSGHPSAKQKREARDSARARLEAEAKDGRYTRRKAYPILWDRPSNTLLVASSAESVLTPLAALFQETFGSGLTFLGSGAVAGFAHPDIAIIDQRPSGFQPGATHGEVAWVPDRSTGNFLGNEFLLWLWYQLDGGEDSIELPDSSEATVMFARTLALECPRAMTGSESIRSDAPTRLPEARRAIMAGKLPRKAGLTVARHGQLFELTVQGETLAVSGAKLPDSEAEDPRGRLDERIDSLRHMIETLDLLYKAFLHRRLGEPWLADLGRMQRWLQKDERGQKTPEPKASKTSPPAEEVATVNGSTDT